MLATKIFFGTTIPLGLATTSYASYEIFLKPKNIGQKLEWYGHKLLSTIPEDSNPDQSKWTEIVNKYKQQDESSFLAFIGSNTGTEENDKIKALKEKCHEILKKPISKSHYENAEKFCVHKT